MSSQPRYRVGGNPRVSTSASPASSMNLASSGRRASRTAADSPTQSPSASRRRRSSGKPIDYIKQPTQVAKTLSFAPEDLLIQRRTMCARRNEVGAEKVVCGGKTALDSPSSYVCSWNANRTFFNPATDGAGNPQQQQQQQIGMNPIDSPSPLDRMLRMSPIRSPTRDLRTSPSAAKKKQQHSKTDDDDDDDDDGSAGYEGGKWRKKKKNRRHRGKKADGDGDEEHVDEEEEGYDDEDGFEAVPHELPLPDWRVLCGKELYAKNLQERKEIEERYAVALNPVPEKRGGRRSSVAPVAHAANLQTATTTASATAKSHASTNARR